MYLNPRDPACDRLECPKDDCYQGYAHDGDGDKCRACGGKGWITEERYMFLTETLDPNEPDIDLDYLDFGDSLIG